MSLMKVVISYKRIFPDEEGYQIRKTEGRELAGAVPSVEACVSKCMPPEFAVLEVLKEFSVYRATKGVAGERGAAELCEVPTRRLRFDPGHSEHSLFLAPLLRLNFEVHEFSLNPIITFSRLVVHGLAG